MLDTAQKLKDYGILDTAERLERWGGLDTAQRISDLQADLERSGLENLSDGIVQAQMGPLAHIRAEQQENVARRYADMMSSIDPQAYSVASNLAAQTLNSINQSGLSTLGTISTRNSSTS